ncbi:iron ABC transporter permease [Archangium minus]|uniref:Iron ABC transporter permease n=1 Tax=Archangium minus TaxID=83450 RepID=A0ABY9WWW0_9BACT|nr:iron ABC transporter permease [Archangium minus]
MDWIEVIAAASGDSLATGYRRYLLVRLLVIAGFAAALVLSFLFDVATGPSTFPVGDIVTGLIEPSALDAGKQVILWDVRLPYAVMAVLVGAALGLSGAEMQTVLNNPLASPFTLGISGAATLGASLAIVFQFDLPGVGSNYVISASAFVGAICATLLIQSLSRFYGASLDVVVLFGIALYFAFQSMVSLVHFMADASASQEIIFWTMGSLSRANWDKIGIVAVTLALCLPLSMRQSWSLTALRGGEDHARSLGISVERLRLLVLLRVSLLAAVAVSFVGEIAFVGLVGPHIARMALGENHKVFLPGSTLAGALSLSLASIVSKSLVPGLILPVGMVTTFVGIPLFVGLILAQRRRS